MAITVKYLIVTYNVINEIVTILNFKTNGKIQYPIL